MSEKLLLIDGHSLLFRAFYGMPGNMTAPDGTPTGAVYGFLTILRKVVEDEKPQYLACAFDLSAPTFRHKMYPDYKGTRKAAPEEFHVQVPLVKKILKDMGIPVITCEGWEADDILGSLARQAEDRDMDAVILSGDRDLLQLASPRILIVLPKAHAGKTTYERYTPEAVKEAFGVTPHDFIELKALMGDTSDNVPGLPGVGPKTAQKIMDTYGSIENAHAHVDEMKPKKAMEAMRDHYDTLQMSLDLVTIRTNAPVTFDMTSFRLEDFRNEAVRADFRELGLKTFLKDFENEAEVPTPRTTWSVIRDLADAEKLFDAYGKCGMIGLSFCAAKDRLLALGLTDGKDISVFFAGGFLPEDYLTGKIRALLEKEGRVAVMDAKACAKIFEPRSVDHLFDCVVASYLLDPLKSDWDAASSAMGHLKKTIPTWTGLFGKEDPAKAIADGSGEERAASVLAGEASSACELLPILKDKLDEEGMLDLFATVEMPLTGVLASMEKIGMLCSRDEIRAYGDSLTEGIDKLTKSIYEAAGEEFNIN